MKRIFVPRFFDTANHNAQNLNAKAILAHAGTVNDMQFHGVFYDNPMNLPKSVRLTRLWRGVLYKLHMIFLYQGNYDAIFYPGKMPFDKIGLWLRRITGRSIPIIATLEGLPGDEVREQSLGGVIGHKVFCNRMPTRQIKIFDAVHRMADHIIAISPFLATAGQEMFGGKCSVVQLGVDTDTFYYDPVAEKLERTTVICSGTAYSLKRPEFFLKLAETNLEADFIWYGGGRENLLDTLNREIQEKKLPNIEFRGAVNQQKLAEAYRQAHLFVLPSLSEGVPKVSQEAAACGLPLVMFGHFEAPSLVDGKNGRVVWSDEEFIEAVASLVQDEKQRKAMGLASAEMAKNWGWEQVAPLWLEGIQNVVHESR